MFDNKKREFVTAIIPAFNAERSIAHVVRAAGKFVDDTIVVDDGSTDKTATFAKNAGARVVRNEYDHGAHYAILYGIEKVVKNSNIVVTLDAYGQHPADVIPRLVRPILDGRAGFVLGRRNRLPPSERPVRLAVQRILKNSHDEMDVGTGYRAIVREFVLGVDPKKDVGYCSCGSLLLYAMNRGARTAEVPYIYEPRRFGRSKFRNVRKTELHRRQALFLKARYSL